MNWEVFNGITGLISALCALFSIGYLTTHKESSNDIESENILPIKILILFSLVCSGWALSCLSFLWFFEPFGSFVSPKDYQNFFGIIISLPAFMIFLYGLKSLAKINEKDFEN